LIKKEQSLANNVARTINMFPDMRANYHFGDDKDCYAMIENAHSRELADFFTKERDGRYKSDLCRLAQLYLTGGYYLDNDLEPISDFRSEIPPCTELVSVASNQSGIFQALLGAPPRHPAIQLAMNLTLQHYEKRLKELPNGPLGTSIMELALRDYTGTKHMNAGASPNGVFLLEEKAPEHGRFKDEHMERYDACNFGVYHADKQLFYSRSIGAWTGQRCKRTERWSWVLPGFLQSVAHVLDFVSAKF
jgi:hypothetical protein